MKLQSVEEDSSSLLIVKGLEAKYVSSCDSTYVKQYRIRPNEPGFYGQSISRSVNLNLQRLTAC